MNPKAWLICVAVVGAYLRDVATGDLGTAARPGVVFALAAAPGLLVWLGFGAVVQRALRTERAAR